MPPKLDALILTKIPCPKDVMSKLHPTQFPYKNHKIEEGGHNRIVFPALQTNQEEEVVRNFLRLL